MSITTNILPHQFHTLSQQNHTLNQKIITITLNHQQLLRENHQLQEVLKNKQYALIESTLREKNLHHSLTTMKEEYLKLQSNYKQLHDLINTNHKLSITHLYQKQSQLAFDIANIQRQSYRQTKKINNQQINLYQQKLINLAKQNDSLKLQILQITSQYNTKIYQLKTANILNQTKLKALKDFDQNKLQNQQNPIFPEIKDFQTLQLQLKLQNTKEELQFYIKQNAQIKKRNIKLNTQVDRLLAELKQALQDRDEQTKEQNNTSLSTNNQLWRALNKENSSVQFVTKVLEENTKLRKEIEETALNKENSSVQFVTKVLEENTKLRKEIEETTSKYILLTETYPKLVDQFETISELESNMQKLNEVKSLQGKLRQAQKKCTFLTQSLTVLQTKLLSQIKSRQSLQYKTSILTKRFNQIFIKMNPYFDIYQYQSLELNQQMCKFFQSRKDYKSLKEYEQKVLTLKRQMKQMQVKRQCREREQRMKMEERQREIERVNKERQEVVRMMEELSDVNKVMKVELSKYQMMLGGGGRDEGRGRIQEEEGGEQIGNQRNQQGGMNAPQKQQHQLSLKVLQHQVTIPLLQQFVNNLHAQRQQLLKTIYMKDKALAKYQQQIHSLKLNQTIKVLDVSSSEKNSVKASSSGNIVSNSSTYGQLLEFPSISVQFSDLLNKLNESQQKHNQTITKLEQQLIRVKTQLTNQHHLYQLELKNYQHQYERKLFQMKQLLNNWTKTNEQLRLNLQLNHNQHRQQNYHQKQQNYHQDNNTIAQESNLIDDHNRQTQMIQQHSQSLHLTQQPLNPPSNQPIRNLSHSNLDKIPIIPYIQQDSSNNKLIGESTVQTLTQTLKKYQQDMNQVLAMCVKVSKDYTDLKEKVKQHQDLEKKNLELNKECENLKSQLQKTKGYLKEKNEAICSMQSLYRSKSSYCDEVKQRANSSVLQIKEELEREKKVNERLSKDLQEMKERLYELGSKGLACISSSSDQSVMSKGQLQTILIMQDNKNKQIWRLVQRNKQLQNKLSMMMQQMKQMRMKEHTSGRGQFGESGMQRREMMELSRLLEGTNVMELVRRANEIVERERRGEGERGERDGEGGEHEDEVVEQGKRQQHHNKEKQCERMQEQGEGQQGEEGEI